MCTLEGCFGFFINLFIYLFIFGCVGSSVRARAFSSCGERGLLFVAVRWLLLLRSMGSRHTGFSSCGSRASVVVAHGLSSCGSGALGAPAQ